LAPRVRPDEPRQLRRILHDDERRQQCDLEAPPQIRRSVDVNRPHGQTTRRDLDAAGARGERPLAHPRRRELHHQRYVRPDELRRVADRALRRQVHRHRRSSPEPASQSQSLSQRDHRRQCRRYRRSKRRAMRSPRCSPNGANPNPGSMSSKPPHIRNIRGVNSASPDITDNTISQSRVGSIVPASSRTAMTNVASRRSIVGWNENGAHVRQRIAASPDTTTSAISQPRVGSTEPASSSSAMMNVTSRMILSLPSESVDSPRSPASPQSTAPANRRTAYRDAPRATSAARSTASWSTSI